MSSKNPPFTGGTALPVIKITFSRDSKRECRASYLRFILQLIIKTFSMPLRVLQMHMTIHKDRNGIVVPISKAGFYRRKDNRVLTFLNQFNPANWFSEFKDIKISLEEFARKQE